MNCGRPFVRAMLPIWLCGDVVGCQQKMAEQPASAKSAGGVPAEWNIVAVAGGGNCCTGIFANGFGAVYRSNFGSECCWDE